MWTTGGECASLNPVSAMLPLWKPQTSSFPSDNDDDNTITNNHAEKKDDPNIFVRTATAAK